MSGSRETNGRQDPAASAGAISLAHHFAHSDRFRVLFADGMALVEETADYLDGDGRAASRGMEQALAASYSTESMRLTTRLMQLASWLLLQRAVAEGDMTPEQAIAEKQNVRLDQPDPVRGTHWDALPEAFRSLVDRSIALQRRLRLLDEEIYAEGEAPLPGENPVANQHRLLETAFFPTA